MKAKAALLAVCALALPFLLASSVYSRISLPEARVIIEAHNRELAPVELVELTTQDVWRKTGCQIFRNTRAPYLETFAIKNRGAKRLGKGFEGSGVTSVIAKDIDGDGRAELVYAYSWGAGHFSAVVSWLDTHDYSEHESMDNVYCENDLILKIENQTIVVYEVKNTALEKLGIMVWEQDELRYNAE